MKRLATVLILFCLAAVGFAAETIPPKPAGYFNDYANVLPAATALQLNERLAEFERQSSDQIVVAIYPKMESDSDIADYATRVFRSWKVGQAGKNNGAVLFVFVQDHKWFLNTGYGLEGALPDALCKTIMEHDATPRFRAGDYGGGLSAALADLMLAAKGEYHGTGRTVSESRAVSRDRTTNWIIYGIFGAFILLSLLTRGQRRRGWLMSGGGWGGYSGGWGGGSWGGGGGGGGGFSGFSGGGGSSGGGGAGGSW